MNLLQRMALKGWNWAYVPTMSPLGDEEEVKKGKEF